MTGIELIEAERARQAIREHAGEHAHNDPSELIRAAEAYLLSANASSAADEIVAATKWPWSNGFDPQGATRDLIRAGALVAAALDRMRA